MRYFASLVLVLLISSSHMLFAVKSSVGTMNGHPVLLVDGLQYEIKGLTLSWDKSDLPALEASLLDIKSLGANCVRTWGAGEDTKILLDMAEKHGIKVMVGLWMRHGKAGMEGEDSFNYVKDETGKAEQLANTLKWVEAYKNHPAVLMWGIGNEVTLNIATEPEKVAYAKFLEKVCQAVKKADPDHAIASVSAWSLDWPYWQKYAPSVEVYGINVYGPGAGAVYGEWQKYASPNKPYVVTEFGARGEWDIQQKDKNGMLMEPNDYEKYDTLANGWNQWIGGGKPACIGGFVFNYSTTFDHTGIWLNLKIGSRFRPQYWGVRKAFTGKEPEKPLPRISKFKIPEDAGVTGDWLKVELGTEKVENPKVSFWWNSREGERLEKAKIHPLKFQVNADGQYEIQVPERKGVLKIYAFVSDQNKNLAVAMSSIVSK